MRSVMRGLLVSNVILFFSACGMDEQLVGETQFVLREKASEPTEETNTGIARYYHKSVTFSHTDYEDTTVAFRFGLDADGVPVSVDMKDLSDEYSAVETSNSIVISSYLERDGGASNESSYRSASSGRVTFSFTSSLGTYSRVTIRKGNTGAIASRGGIILWGDMSYTPKSDTSITFTGAIPSTGDDGETEWKKIIKACEDYQLAFPLVPAQVQVNKNFSIKAHLQDCDGNLIWRGDESKSAVSLTVRLEQLGEFMPLVDIGAESDYAADTVLKHGKAKWSKMSIPRWLYNSIEIHDKLQYKAEATIGETTYTAVTKRIKIVKKNKKKNSN